MPLPGFICDACRTHDEHYRLFDPRCATCMDRGMRGYRLDLVKREAQAHPAHGGDAGDLA